MSELIYDILEKEVAFKRIKQSISNLISRKSVLEDEIYFLRIKANEEIKAFQKTLKPLLKLKNITMEDIAIVCNVTKQSVSKWCSLESTITYTHYQSLITYFSK